MPATGRRRGWRVLQVRAQGGKRSIDVNQANQTKKAASAAKRRRGWRVQQIRTRAGKRSIDENPSDRQANGDTYVAVTVLPQHRTPNSRRAGR